MEKEKEKEMNGATDSEAMKKEITHLKLQLAGSKGAYTRLSTEHKELADENQRLKSEMSEKEETINKLRQELTTARFTLNRLTDDYKEIALRESSHRAVILWYNGLPWYKKIFVSKIAL